MRKLLNTLYITCEQAWLTLDGNNIVCKVEEEGEKFRIPFDNVENIVCFSYLGCSPALMGKCAENLIPISLRFYYLGNNWHKRIEHIGAKPAYDPEGVIIL